jgi:selenocysteine lyase/cysteine desulfurase
MTDLLPSQRHLFDIPDDITYVNCAYLSPLMRKVADAGRAGLARKQHPWTITRHHFHDDVEKVREAFARLIGGKADDIALIPSSSYGTATAAANLRAEKGQSIVLIEGEHGSNVRIWHVMARDLGLSLKTVPMPADGNWTAGLLEAIDASTAIVAVPPLHWTDGSLVDLMAVGARARAVGAAFVVDATQWIGAAPLDVAEIRPDFLVCSAYKWLMCPYTLGFLYVAPKHQKGRPLEQHGFNRAGAEKEGATDYPEEFLPGARRYDMGERSNWINLPMAIEAIEQLIAWQPARTAATIRELTETIVERGRKLGFGAPPQGHRAPHMVGLKRAGMDPGRVVERLAAERIFISGRGAALRISPHLYNSQADVARLMDGLARLA